MRKLAFSAMVLAALGMLGCGGGGAKVYIPRDGGGDGGTCDPYMQTGCGSGEKCAQKVDQLANDAGSPTLSRTACVPDGTVAAGGACDQVGPVDQGMGYDNCQHGLECINNVCVPICTTMPDSCGKGQLCGLFTGLFSEFTNYGVCQPTCDPVAQDCMAAADACYLRFTDGKGLCAPPGTTATRKIQDQECDKISGNYYLNSCAKGYGCTIPKDPANFMGPQVCAFFCNPGNTTDDQGKHIGCGATFSISYAASGADAGVSDGGVSDGGAADAGATPPDAGAPPRPNGPGTASFECRYLNSFYSNTGSVPGNVGVCVNTNIWGKCSDPSNMQTNGCKPAATTGARTAKQKASPALLKALKEKGYLK